VAELRALRRVLELAAHQDHRRAELALVPRCLVDEEERHLLKLWEVFKRHG
jgi:hypothetical protein